MRLSVALMFIGLYSLNAKAATVALEKGTNDIEFVATGRPSALRVHGRMAEDEKDKKSVKGTLMLSGNSLSGTAIFHLDALDTGIGLRTTHMKEKYLETGKYPDSELKFTEFKLPPGFLAKDSTAEGVAFKGLLTLHGKTNPVSGMATARHAGNSLALDTSFGLKLSDFGIDIPKYLGITIADEVEVTVKTKAPIENGGSGPLSE